MTDPASPRYTLRVEDILGGLKTTRQGLSTADAHRRLRETGPNRIERAVRRPWFRTILHRIADPLAYFLLTAAKAFVARSRLMSSAGSGCQ